MFYKRRELCRLWEVEIYEQDPNENSGTPTRVETLIAWNEVGAIRQAGGRVASRPTAICYVTHPRQDPTGNNNIYRVDDPKKGPVGEPITPSIQTRETEDDW